MALKREFCSVLIVSATEKSASLISDMLDKSLYYPIAYAMSGTEARQLLMRKDYDLIVINAPLSDEFGHDLSIHISEKTYSSVIMMVKNQLYDSVSTKVVDYGIFTIGKPVDKHLFHQMTRVILAGKEKLAKYRKENDKLKLKLDEIRLVSQAKCLLVEYLRMSEAQAHRYIEKRAMDERTTKTKVAEDIIDTYEAE